MAARAITVSSTGDARIDVLLGGQAWRPATSGKTILTVAYYNDGGTWSASERPLLLQALKAWENVANIDFKFTTTTSSFRNARADLAITATGNDLHRFEEAAGIAFYPFNSAFTGSLLGRSYTGNQYPNAGGDVFFDDPVTGSYVPGNFDYFVLLHELGHALGLKHPHEQEGVFPAAVGSLRKYDSINYSVLTSPFAEDSLAAAPPSDHYGWSATPMPLDILAIQELYGANTTFHAGNDTYILQANDLRHTVWDAGGKDRIDASQLTEGITLSLAPGALNFYGNGAMKAIAFNVTLENVLGTDFNDRLTGNNARNVLHGEGGNDLIYGGRGNDFLVGGEGNDVLIGNAGRDRLFGQGGDDTYYIDSGTEINKNIVDPGIDKVLTTVSYRLGEHQENLVLRGTRNLRAIGNNEDNILTGNRGANRLLGFDGDDILDGGAGRDVLIGGRGNDTYILTHSTEVAKSKLDAGIDTINSSFSYVLGAHQENITLRTSKNINAIGNSSDNILIGNNGSNLINGAAGDDFLDGRGGVDRLFGKDGNDIYIIDNAGEISKTAIDNGFDEVRSTVSYTLGDQQESLTLLGTDNIDATGNDSNNVIVGNTGVNVLSGLGGDDFLVTGSFLDTINGGTGTDTLVLTAGDKILNLGTANIQQVEVIDLNFPQNYTLVFDEASIQSINPDTSKIQIKGGANSGLEFDIASWTNNGSSIIDGLGFTEYQKGSAVIQVQNALSIRLAVTDIQLGTLDGSNGFSIDGVTRHDNSGYTVSGAGDFNNDGFADVIIGARLSDVNNSNAGTSYVVFGNGSGFSSTLELSGLDGSNGIQINGFSTNGQSGYSVSSAGDVNNDGIDDIIVGAPFTSAPDGPGGESYVVFGRSTGFTASFELSSLDGTNGFKINSVNTGDNLGVSVSSVSDFNGDGLSDLVIGARRADPNGSVDAGETYIVFGKDSGFSSSIDLADINGTDGFKLNGISGGDYSGHSVSTAGDVNGDGFADLIIGARGVNGNGSDTGESYVLFGGASSIYQDIDFSALDGSIGFKLTGINVSDDSGYSVSGAGDVNGDGFDDIVIGARAADPNGSSSGEAYVVFGKNTGFTSSIDLSNLDGTNGFQMHGLYAGDSLGFSVSRAGDFNADGVDDLLVSAVGADRNDFGSGSTYLIFGTTSGFDAEVDLNTLAQNREGIVIEGVARNDHSGSSVAAAGDVNGDGFDDIVIGAPGADAGDTDTGKSYVVFGRSNNANSGLIGGTGNDILSGTLSDEILIGGAGEDILDGAGGTDVLIGASGDDILVFDGTDELRVDGGSGIDTLRFDGANQSLDLVSNRTSPFESIEIISLEGSGANSLLLDKLALVNLSESSNTLQVSGGADDAVTLVGNFINTGSLVINGQNYTEYTDGTAIAHVQDSISSLTFIADDNAAPAALVPADLATSLLVSTDLMVDGLKVVDIDAGMNEVEITLTTDIGTLSLGQTTNLVFSTGDGTEDASIIFRGNIDDVNAALAGVTFQKSFGLATVSLGIDDLGSTGTGGALVDAESFTINTRQELILSELDGFNGFSLNGIAFNDQSGGSVAAAGDINGDGLGDFIIGAPESDANGNRSGESYVVFGTSAPTPSTIELSSLDGTNGFSISGTHSDQFFGYSLSAAGDVNNDGIGDLLIGAPELLGNTGESGGSFVVFGSSSGFSSSIDLATLDGSNGLFIDGIVVGDDSGISVSGAGDVNGDGVNDLIIGASSATANGSRSGESYVVFGKAGAYDATLDLSTLDGTNGFHLNGVDANDFSGISVSSAGDINGDGYDDVVVGAYRADPNGLSNGETYVVYGRNAGFDASLELNSLDGTTGFSVEGIGLGDDLGRNVSNAGDVNGDGIGDLIIGARHADSGGNNSGESYVLFGNTSGFSSTVDLSSLDGSDGYKIIGANSEDRSGHSVSSAGDVNGDGYDDIIIGAYAADPSGNGSGESYIVFGKASGFGASLDLSSLNNSSGIILEGINANDLSGKAVSGAGDINGDGFDDILVGAPLADPNFSNSGQSYVVFGKDFREEADLVGTMGDDILAGSSADEILVGGLGDDILDGAEGNDVLIGAAGDDVLVFDSVDQLRVDGGSGVDTLRFDGAGQNLDLIAERNGPIEGIEIIDLTGSGSNTLTLDTLSLVSLSDISNTLQISGNADDVVTLEGHFVNTASLVIDGQNYSEYTNGVAVALVQDAISSLTILAPPNIAPESLTPEDITSSALVSTDLVISGLGVSDLDAGALPVQVTLSTDLGSLSLSQVSGLSFSAGDGTTDMLMSFTGNLADINAALSNATFQKEFGVATITLTVDDLGNSGSGGALQDSESFTIDSVLSLSFNRLDGANGFTINGVDAGDNSGFSVSSAGDVNGDGLDDLMIGARRADPVDDDNGETYIVFGQSSGFPATFELSSLDGSNGFVLTGINRDDFSGQSISTAGDINNDGFSDLLIGAWGADPNGSQSGESYIVFGKASGYSASIALDLLDGSNGFQLNGIDPDDASGISVSTVGDINTDGLADIIIGAWGADPNGSQSGESYVVFGKTSGFETSLDLAGLNGANGFRINGKAAFDVSGFSVASAGDVNGDGIDDVIIGAFGAQGGDPFQSAAGESYIVFGKKGGFEANFELSSLDGSNGFQVNGIVRNDNSGVSVSSAGDVNGDGIDDIIIGADEASTANGSDSGESYVVFGSDSGFSATFELSSLDGSNGFQIDGASQYDEVGHSVSFAGDMNGDGYDDLIIGSRYADPGGSRSGESYVLFGKPSGFSSLVDLSALNIADGIFLHGANPDDQSGHSVSAAGDINGDGFDDVIIGAKYADPAGKGGAGESYLIYGKDFRNEADYIGTAGIDNLTGTGSNENLIGGLGDDILDGAGGNDVLIGGAGDDVLVLDLADTVRVDGGHGIDTLRFDGAGQSLDLKTNRSSAFENFEIIDFDGSGANTLILDTQALLYLSDTSNALQISGGADDSLSLEGNFFNNGATVINGQNFTEYTDGNAVVHVQDTIGSVSFVLGPNDAPAVVVPLALTTSQLGPSGLILDGLEIIDSDAGPNDVEISFSTDIGSLSLSQTTGLVFTSGDGTEDSAMIFRGTLTDINAALNGAVYHKEFGMATLTLAVDDLGSSGTGGPLSDSESFTVTSNLIMSLDQLDGSNGYSINGIAQGDNSGISVSSAGDINNDGLDDIIIGAHFADPGGVIGAGQSYVVFGQQSGHPASLDLSSLDGTNGFQINGIFQSDLSGRPVSSAGDVNNDGIDDLLIGASEADATAVNSGAAYVIFGGGSYGSSFELSSLDGSNGFQLNGINAGDRAGFSLSAAGDINGDGIADLLIGAPNADPDGHNAKGESYVVFGQDGGFSASLDLANLNGNNGFVVQGVDFNDESGNAVSMAGDVNGDGIDDLIIGAWRADEPNTDSGESYVVFGKSSGFDASIKLSDLDGNNGFRLRGIDGNDLSGMSVSGAGDINGDGLDDLIIGAFFADANGSQSGESYVVFGNDIGFSSSIDLSGLDGTNGFQVNGILARDFSGVSVSSAGDVNGDGYGDLLIGAHSADSNGNDSGESYLVFGKSTGFGSSLELSSLGGSDGAIIRGVSVGDNSGRSVSSAGDINGDGFDDVLIGAYRSSINGSTAGQSYVIFGGDYLGEIDFKGGSGNDVLIGSGADEVLIGAQGDDILEGGGGNDVLIGAAGDDILVYDSADQLRVDGGSGTDTLRVDGSGQVLDLISDRATHIEGVEVIDLDGTGANALLLDTLALVSLSDNDNTLRIGGGADDAVTLRGGFINSGTVLINGQNYTEYSDGVAIAQVADSISSVTLVQDINNAPVSIVPADLTTSMLVLTDLSIDGLHVFDVDAGSDNVEVTLSTDLGSLSLSQTTGLTFSNGDGSEDSSMTFSGSISDINLALDGVTYQKHFGLATVTLAVDDLGNNGTGGALQDSESFTINSEYVLSLADLETGSGFTLNGMDSNSRSGRSVSSAGDVNGDGFDDVIIGAYHAVGAVPAAGESYVVFGEATGVPAQVELASLDGTNGFILNGIDNGDDSGFSVSSAGDINNDGFDDLLIGAPEGDAGGGSSGETYVVFGKAAGFAATLELSLLDGINGFQVTGQDTSDRLGFSVSSAGDMNGDGLADMLIGARTAEGGGGVRGETYVVFGNENGYGDELDLNKLNGVNGFQINGIADGDASGSTVSAAGDVNGDGIDDVIIGAYLANPTSDDEGQTYIVFGKTEIFDKSLDLASLDGTNGFILNGVDVNDFSGRSISSAGDINGDGVADIIIGANEADPNGSRSGESYVLFGQAGGFVSSINLADIDGVNGFTVNGAGYNHHSGYAVSGAGDVNADGLDDLLIGAHGTGESYVIYGRTAGFSASIELSGLGPADGFVLKASPGISAGRSVSGAGDVNGDGYDDIIIGAPFADPNNFNAGESYLVYGNNFSGDVDYAGTAGDDSLSGTAANESLVGGLGDDLLDGAGGSDVLIGAAGDDVLVYDAADTLRVDGGSGLDTLRFDGAGQSLDLVSDRSTPINGIEIIELDGSGANSLFLDKLSLVSLSDTSNMLRISGGADDAVSLKGHFVNSGSVIINGLNYTEYSDGVAVAQVQDAINSLTLLQGDNQGPASLVPNAQETSQVLLADFVIPDLQVFDADSGANHLEVTLGTDLGSLSLSQATGLIFSVGDGVEDTTMTFRGSVTDVNAALAGTTFQKEFGVATVTLSVDDLGNSGAGGASQDSESFTINTRPELVLNQLDGIGGFQIDGIAADDSSGLSVASAGDVNGDGFDDFIIGATSADPNGNFSAGESYVVFGAASGFPTSFSLFDLDGSNGFKLSGINSADGSGRSVSGVGDINNDGLSDILVGAPSADPNGSASGQAYIIYGSSSGFSPNIDLSGLDGINGFQINGIDSGDELGGSVSHAGDVNGDGLADMIIGARGGDANGNVSGESYLVFGQANGFGSTLELSGLNGVNGVQLNGIDAVDFSGHSVSNAGDVNGDGVDDLIIGAYRADPNGSDSGESYVVFGKTGNFSESIELSALDGSNGFILNGIDFGDNSGYSVSTAGDINGDGIDDLIIGAWRADPTPGDTGESYVVFGQTGGFTTSIELSALDGTNGFQLNGVAQTDRSGVSVSTAGDINADGYDDIIIGSYLADPNGTESGESYIVFGKASGYTATFDLADVDGSNGIVVEGASFRDWSGWAVSNAGDVNGDGYEDVIIGAREADVGDVIDAGKSYLLFGRDFRSDVDFEGTAGDDMLGGTAADEALVGGLGDDVLDGSAGNDVLIGAAGDDVLVYDAADRTRVDGGSGMDTLRVDTAGQVIDLVADRTTPIEGIEIIDLNGSGANSLLLDKLALVSLSDTSNVLRISGGADDGVSLTGHFVNTGSVVIDGQSYTEYSDGAAIAQVQDSILSITLLDGPNDAPISLVPDSLTTSMLVFSDFSIPNLGIYDSDARGADIEVTLSTDLGSLSLGQTTGLNFTAGDGIEDMMMTFTGSLSDINGALSGSSFQKEFGLATVTLLVDDLGSSGTGTALSDSKSFIINSNYVLKSDDLDGTNGFTINGINQDDRSGRSVSSAGDINDDGYDDILIGAYQADPGGSSQSGQSYVVFGSASGFSSSFELSTLDGSNGFSMNGIDVDDNSGLSVSAAGDLNSDGIDDLVIGAFGGDAGDTNSGESYVLFGKSTAFSSSIELSSLDGSNGFQINGIDSADNSGVSVSNAGDINGDGYDDLIVGANGADANGINSGESYVIFGDAAGFSASIDLSTLDGTNGFKLNGIQSADSSGISVADAGDVNGDGIDDLLIGANRASPASSSSGEAYVVFGKADGFSASVNLSNLDGSNGFELTGIGSHTRAGTSVSSAGDINGDGYSDILVGANGADTTNGSNTGQIYVIFGKQDGFSASTALHTLDGSNGFIINGESQNDNSGLSVSGAGDVNGDGFDDIIIGALLADAPNSDSGKGYVVFGKASGFSTVFELSALSTNGGYIIEGSEISARTGISVSGAGDIDGDGLDDVIVGSSFANAGTGKSHLIFGHDLTGNIDFAGTSANDNLTGTSTDENLLGSQGNDTLDGGAGNDVLKGGAGDDILVFDSADTLKIDGGSGLDTLRFDGAGESLDLTNISNLRYQGIERFELTGTGNNSLDLDIRDVLALPDAANAFLAVGTKQVLVDGDSGDTVNFDGVDLNLVLDTKVFNGETYNSVMAEGIAGELLIHQDLSASFVTTGEININSNSFTSSGALEFSSGQLISGTSSGTTVTSGSGGSLSISSTGDTTVISGNELTGTIVIPDITSQIIVETDIILATV